MCPFFVLLKLLLKIFIKNVLLRAFFTRFLSSSNFCWSLLPHRQISGGSPFCSPSINLSKKKKPVVQDWNGYYIQGAKTPTTLTPRTEEEPSWSRPKVHLVLCVSWCQTDTTGKPIIKVERNSLPQQMGFCGDYGGSMRSFWPPPHSAGLILHQWHS